MAGPFSVNLFGQEHVAPHPHRLAEMLNGAILEELAVSLTSDIELLLNPDRCRVTRTVAGNHTSTGNWQAVAMDVESWDTANMHDNVTNNTMVTATRAGLYSVKGGLIFLSNATGERGVGFRVNGAGGPNYGFQLEDTTTGADHAMTTTDEIVLAVGDDVELVGYQNSGGSLSLPLFGGCPFLSLVWLGN